MKRLSLVLSMVLGALLLVTTSIWISSLEAETAGRVLFSDDFESGTSQWTVVDGTWSIITDTDGTNHLYSQSYVTSYARAIAGSLTWTDYAIQARVKPGSKYAKLIARYQDESNYYFMALRTDNHKIEFKRMVGQGSSLGLGSSQNLGITPSTWYTAVFEVNGPYLRAYINGTAVFTVTDNSGRPPLQSGQIGFGTLDSSAEFDDIVVTSLVPVYTLTVSSIGTGSGAITSTPAGIDCGATCAAGFDSGTVVTLTAKPDDGSSMAAWLGACTGSDACVVTMDAAKLVTAVFSSLSQPMLIVHKDGDGSGSITSEPAGIDCGANCAAAFSQGGLVTLTAVAGDFSTFAAWGGACLSPGTVIPPNRCVVPMDQSRWVSATFMHASYPLTVIKAGNGNGTVASTPAGISCGASCTADFAGVVTLTAVASPTSSFIGWDGAGCTGAGHCVVTMTAAQNVTATFWTYQTYLPVVMLSRSAVTLPPLYVAPAGDDLNSGTLERPFQTVSQAVSVASPGQAIYMRGGTYHYSDTVTLSKSGDVVNMYKIWAYPGELPVLDFSGTPRGPFARGFLITGNFWHIKGLEIMNAQDNAIKIEGSYNIIEQCVMHHNQDTGLQIGLASTSTNPDGTIAAYNRIINCDSYLNFDADTNGSNADGFACKLYPGKGNVFTGCRAWENTDDGWDLFLTQFPVVIENSWTWHSGDASLFGNPSAWGGNGNGFKVGGDYNHAAHVVRNCVAFDHKYGSGSTVKGFDQNHNMSGITLYNNLAWDNMVNFSFQEQPDDGTHHVLENNVGFAATSNNVNLSADAIHTHNSWNLAVTADAGDFLSLLAELAKAPRQADGSLPNNDFARLVTTSDLIDQGIDVGLPYSGSAPDLGAFECR
ncbi:MAG: right-handed parallel beta-helix repeat-containing protein [Thermoflexales bacterium]|nr:right-handed parallel beta-helix repeat-containing protein [Thermoflexales bacterium]